VIVNDLLPADGGLTPAARSHTLNSMVKYQTAALDRTFAALADPTRRALLARLGDTESLTVSQLAQPFSMSLPAVMKHLDVLSDAGLVTRNKNGRTVSCQLKAAPMEDAMIWLIRYQRFWTKQLDRLAALVEEKTCPPAPAHAPTSLRSQASRSNVVSMPRRRRSSTRGRGPKR
jgi:DNA-binding transcriptional ArsR family regulator